MKKARNPLSPRFVLCSCVGLTQPETETVQS